MFKLNSLSKTLFFLCCIFYSANIFAQKDEFQRALDLLQKNQLQDSAKADTYTELSSLYQSKNIDSAIWFGSKAIETAVASGNQPVLAKAYMQQACNYVCSNKPDTALGLYFEAKKIGAEIKANDILFNCYNGIANLYATTKTWDKALDYISKALQITNNDSAAGTPAYAYNITGSIYMGLNNYEDALVYFSKAKSGFIQSGDLECVAECCSNMSRLYIILQQYPQAKQQLDSALLIFSSLDKPIEAAGVYEGYGNEYTATQQYDSAANNYNRALQIYRDNKMDDDAAKIQLDLGKMFLAQQQYSKAKDWLLQSYNYFKINNEKENQLQTIIALAQTDSALGNPQNALGYLREYKSLSDSLNNEKIALRTHQMLVEFGVEKQEKENLLLRQENINTKNWWIITIWGSIVILIIAIALLLLYRRKYKINKEAQVSQMQTSEAYKELTEVSEMKDKLFSILAHDLRSPLANTQHLLQLTKTGAIDNDIFTQLAAELEVNLDYNRELLDNLLSWARSQMNGIVIVLKEIKLRKLTEDNLSLFASVAEKKQVKLLNMIDESCTILADENVVRMALRNTISNAIKFSYPGKAVTISAETKANKILIKIHDDGIGIPEAAKKNIFTFQTISARGTQQEKGAGIGLRITMEMVQKMNGKIWIESKEGEGTTAFIETDKAR